MLRTDCLAFFELMSRYIVVHLVGMPTYVTFADILGRNILNYSIFVFEG